MEQKQAAKLLSENLHTLYAYSLAKLYDKSQAEDLTGDIVCAVLSSVSRLQNDDAFYGFMWRIAENTFCSHIRKKRPETVEFDEAFVGTYWPTPEEDVVKNEELALLRRELALLSRRYREVAVAYYIRGNSCREIAHSLSVSTDTVKYILSRTRKILKEGLNMQREFGEKSYNPGVFRMDFWGNGDNSCYWHLFKRQLPGNILLSAYDAPRTLQELSVELGVSAVYLEEELALLMEHDILCKTGDRYQTNIILFTDEFEKALGRAVAPLCEAAAAKFDAALTAVLPHLCRLPFHGNNFNENRLKWAFANLALYEAFCLSNRRAREQYGAYPPLSNGGNGFVFGYDNEYKNHHFSGIYGHCENRAHTAYFSVENYRVIEPCQRFEAAGMTATVEAMGDAILENVPDEQNDMVPRLIAEQYMTVKDGRLVANFPVFTENVMQQVQEVLKPLSEEVCACMEKVSRLAAERMKPSVPPALRKRCGQLCAIHNAPNVAAWIVEDMVRRGRLTVTDASEKLCVFGVRD